MRFKSFTLAVCVWAAVCATHAETLVVLGDDAYSPVVYTDQGKPAGILPTILTRISALTGDDYKVQLSPWKRAYALALRAEGGVVGVSYNSERAKLFDFSKPIYDDDIQIVTLKDKTFPYNKLDDLKGKVIGGVNGASYGDVVDKAVTAGLFTVVGRASGCGLYWQWYFRLGRGHQQPGGAARQPCTVCSLAYAPGPRPLAFSVCQGHEQTRCAGPI